MSRLNPPKELEAKRKSITKQRQTDKPCITICSGTGCHAYGCEKVAEAFRQEIKHRGLETRVDLRTTGCHGFCERGPLVVIRPKSIFYQQVSVDDVPEIISVTILKDNII